MCGNCITIWVNAAPYLFYLMSMDDSWVPRADVAGCDAGSAGLGEPVQVCRGVGHATCKGGTLPVNPFGAAFLAQNFMWTKELCQADSDNDGQTNGEELGDPCCTWKVLAESSMSRCIDRVSREVGHIYLPAVSAE